MNELALFAGAGGGILGGKLLGWRCVCAVELDEYCRDVLMQRQNDGVLDPFPIWDDVRTFDGHLWYGRVDVVTGGFPCQDISSAGPGAGITGERSGLWTEFARIIREVRPRFAFVENSPLLTKRGLGVVLGDLAEMGFDAEWGVLGADDVGAPHIRKRIWIVADAMPRRRHARCAREASREPQRSRTTRNSEEVSVAGGTRLEIGKAAAAREATKLDAAKRGGAVHDTVRGRHGAPQQEIRAGRNGFEHAGGWEVEPDVGRVVNRCPARVDRIKCLGNMQVPAVARLAWDTLVERLIAR